MKENNNKDRISRKTWQFPWGYKESFLVVIELMLVGFILEVIMQGSGFAGIHWPYNAMVGFSLIVIIGTLHVLFRKKPVIKWLSSVPAAVSAITFFAFLVLLLGFLVQNNPHASPVIKMLGLNHIKNSWVFVVSAIYLLTCLGLVTFRRVKKINRKNIGFLLNHAGLWIVLAAGGLGSGDLIRLSANLREQAEPVNIALNDQGKEYKLPFSMKLIDFNIDLYPPKLGIVNAETGELFSDNGKTAFLASKGSQIEIGDWTITVNELLEDAKRDSGIYIQYDSVGSAPAAFVSVTDNSSGKTRDGWLSCGSLMVRFAHLPLDSKNVLLMLTPEAEKYSAEMIIDTGSKSDTITLEVNKPHKVKGYNLYQVSYDERLGKWSDVSVVEAVKDPWLPVVYTGILLLLGGAAYIFWIGNEPKMKEQ